MFDAAASDTTKGGSDDIVLKTMHDLDEKRKKQLDTVKDELTKSVNDVKDDVTKQITVVKDQADRIEKDLTDYKKAAGQKALMADAEAQKQKSFNEILGETIEKNIKAIQSFKKGEGMKSFRLAGFEDETIEETKAVGDMSIANNFPGAGAFLTNVQNRMIESPYDRVWLADILPSFNTNQGQSILYPKENGGEGAAALWEDPTQDKAQMDFDFTSQSAYFKWLAGIVIIDRESLDDVSFMKDYVLSRMLISLKKAENAFILNGSDATKANPVDGLLDVATAYSGSYTKDIEKILDAAWGQIVEDTYEFYNPTTVVITPRKSVALGLNTADGSGEYDLPPGSVGFTNGQLTIGGLQTVKTTQVGAGNFLAFDRNATSFVRRMLPELRMFEDAALAKKNKVMFRVEERATLTIFNNAAIVKGTLS